MLSILHNLEPRISHSQEVIIMDEEQLEEIVLFEIGEIDIGYFIKKKLLYKIRIKDRVALGAYHITFNRSSNYVYKSANLCQGYSIKRARWMEIIKNANEHISLSFKQQILQRYQV